MPATEIRLPLDAIPMGGMKEGAAGDDKVLFVRDASGVRAFQAKCLHLGAPLAKGEICGGRLYCPWHKAAFALADGSLEEPPAVDSLTRYPVRIEGSEAIATLTPEPAPEKTAKSSVESVLLVGSGAAAVACVKTLRREGYDGRITMVGRETHPPYDRTKLSKQFLAKPTPPEKVLIEPDFADRGRPTRDPSTDRKPSIFRGKPPRTRKIPRFSSNPEIGPTGVSTPAVASTSRGARPRCSRAERHAADAGSSGADLPHSHRQLPHQLPRQEPQP